MRTFESGAIRDDDTRKFDYEGFLSPLVLKEYARYMHQHMTMLNGSRRASDDWQKGMPKDALMKSAYRHFLDWHTLHDGYPAVDFDGENVEILDALCGVLFNTMGYMHMVLTQPETKEFYGTPLSGKELTK